MKKLCILSASLATALMANGTELIYNMNQEFSGGQAPGGTTPWVTLTLTDVGQPVGTVKLTIDNVGLLSTENMSSLYFNFDDTKDLDALSVAFGTKVGTFDTPSVTKSEDALKADGDGLYDIRLSFAVGGNASKVFAGGESLVVILSDGPTLNPADFAFLSEDDGGHGPFAAAAHIQNTTGAGTGGSGWIAGSGLPTPRIVPPPPPPPVPDQGSGLTLLCGSLLGLGLLARKHS